MLKRIALLLSIAIVSFAAACTTPTPPPANKNTTQPTPTPVVAKVDLSSPKATLTAFVEGVKKKDVEAIKATLSKNTLDIAKEVGDGDPNKAINDVLNDNKGTLPASVETKDEKIEAEKATMKVKDGEGNWIDAKFVKEGNEWKYDMADDLGKK